MSVKILLARSAGFCFGVSKAVDSVNRLLDEGKTVYTLGPIIHNPQLVAQLEKMDLSVEKIEQVYESFDAMGIQIVGAELDLDLD